ncbi:MAG: IS3 family transposase [Chitinophagales bacterium]|nr:IS3 family transposase [Chitinophagales bacterium]
MKWLYQVFGITKHAYYKRIKTYKEKERKNEVVLQQVAQIRQQMPQTGTRKLGEHLRPVLPLLGIKMGRDALFNLLRNNELLIRKTKRFHITTDSNHFYYTSPNRIKELHITHAEQVFVSDITYIKTDEAHAYLAVVTDAYSKKIMGWSLEDNMKVTMVKDALTMAHRNCIHHNETIIHHSDRGKQYCCPDYTEFATNKGFVMSTTQKYDPYENAIAERINGILKYEFGFRKTLPTLEMAKKMMKQAVEIYNNKRLHWSLDLQTPQTVHSHYNEQQYKSYAKQAA